MNTYARSGHFCAQADSEHPPLSGSVHIISEIEMKKINQISGPMPQQIA
jgi:hypothetical protein